TISRRSLTCPIYRGCRIASLQVATNFEQKAGQFRRARSRMRLIARARKRRGRELPFKRPNEGCFVQRMVRFFDMRYPQVCLSTNTSALGPDQTNVKQTEETKKTKTNQQINKCSTRFLHRSDGIFGHKSPYSVKV